MLMGSRSTQGERLSSGQIHGCVPGEAGFLQSMHGSARLHVLQERGSSTHDAGGAFPGGTAAGLHFAVDVLAWEMGFWIFQLNLPLWFELPCHSSDSAAGGKPEAPGEGLHASVLRAPTFIVSLPASGNFGAKIPMGISSIMSPDKPVRNASSASPLCTGARGASKRLALGTPRCHRIVFYLEGVIESVCASVIPRAKRGQLPSSQGFPEGESLPFKASVKIFFGLKCGRMWYSLKDPGMQKSLSVSVRADQQHPTNLVCRSSLHCHYTNERPPRQWGVVLAALCQVQPRACVLFNPCDARGRRPAAGKQKQM